MEKHSIDFKTKIELTNEDINDLMCSALEGGINYWVKRVEKKHVPDNVNWDYFSDIISLGGVLEITEEETNEKHELTLSKFMNGVAMTCKHNGFNSGEELIDNHDAVIADCIIQFALFNEIIYG